MARPRKAVDAAMLAAAIGIDRAVEGNVGRLVPGDDVPRAVFMQPGLQRLSLLQIVPAVIFGLARFAVLATAHTGNSAAAAPGIRLPMIGGGGPCAGADLFPRHMEE